MMKLSQIKRSVSISIVTLALALTLPLAVSSVSAFAEEQPDVNTGMSVEDDTEYQQRIAQRAEEFGERAAQHTEEIEARATARAEEFKNRVEAGNVENENGETANKKLAEAKLKVCKNREKTIENIISRLDDRGTKQLDVFTKIAERTQDFYEEKGHQLAGYDALVADVKAKHEAAETAVVDVKGISIVPFECDGADPKGVAESFKASLKARNGALKEYKTAIKNLIVGVKSVQSDIVSEEKAASDTDTTEVEESL